MRTKDFIAGNKKQKVAMNEIGTTNRNWFCILRIGFITHFSSKSECSYMSPGLGNLTNTTLNT